MRKLLLRLHLWTSLAIAVPLLIVGVTGAILVYGEEVDRAINPQLFYVTEGPVRLSAQALIDRVEAAYPHEEIRGASPPTKPDRAFTISTASGLYIHVDPYSGEVLGAQQGESGFRRKMFLLHTQLMAGNVGHDTVIITTLVTIFLTVSGFVLWWKLKIFKVNRIFNVKGWRSWVRVIFDLHNVLGIYSAAVLLILSVTGVLIAYDGVTYPAIIRLGGESPPPPRPQSAPAPPSALTLDDVILAAERAANGARITFVALPQRETEVYTAYARFPEDPAVYGRSRVFIDRYTGDVLGVRSTRDAGWGTHITQIMEPVHFGDIFGMPSRIVTFVVSLLVVGQILSGLLIWWKKRPARARGRRAF